METTPDLHGEAGKYYYAIKCATPDCQKTLLVAEFLAHEMPEQIEDRKRAVAGKRVRCYSCTAYTAIGMQQLNTVIGIR